MEYQLIIIGFGVSGIATARWAQKNNLNYIVLEKEESFGGVWFKTDDDTNLQTGKYFYQFSELDHKRETPDFPSRHHLLEYFNSYISKFNLNEKVEYNSPVDAVEYNRNLKAWEVSLKDKLYRTKYLAICSGFFCNKREVHEINENKEEKVHRNLVVGNGASATDYLEKIYKGGGFSDTQYDLIYKKDKYYANIVTRNLPVSLTINPIYLKFFKHLPLYIFHKLFHIFFTFNKRIPTEKINYTNIIKNDFIYFLERLGKLNIYKKTIDRVEGNQVFFSDNTSQFYDKIINKAGYTRDIKFLNPKIEDINKELGYNYCLPKNTYLYPDLAFIGFAPSYNWVMVSEAQAKWFTTQIKNKNFPLFKDRESFIESRNNMKNSNQDFNDLTYDSIDFAKDHNISNRNVDKILKIFSFSNLRLLLLVIITGVSLIVLKDYPKTFTVTLLIYLTLYTRTMKTKKRKLAIITGIIFVLYGTLSESLVISKTGILKYSEHVKIGKLNIPVFLPLVYLFWSFIVIQIYETINY